MVAKKTATKEATKIFAIERPKPRSDKSKKGARAICEAVNKKHGTNISFRTVEKLVKKGLVGVSPPLRIVANTRQVELARFAELVCLGGRSGAVKDDLGRDMIIVPSDSPKMREGSGDLGRRSVGKDRVYAGDA